MRQRGWLKQPCHTAFCSACRHQSPNYRIEVCTCCCTSGAFSGGAALHARHGPGQHGVQGQDAGARLGPHQQRGALPKLMWRRGTPAFRWAHYHSVSSGDYIKSFLQTEPSPADTLLTQEYMEFRSGEMVTGLLDKAQFGSYGLVHSVQVCALAVAVERLLNRVCDVNVLCSHDWRVVMWPMSWCC